MARALGSVTGGRHRGGFQLVETVVVVALSGALLSVMVPPLLKISGGARVRAAASELVGVLNLARSHAIKLSSNVGVKFRTLPSDRVSFTLYRDGDGDGVRTSDIDSGVDPEVAPARMLVHLGRHVRFGFPPGPPPRDPGDPTRFLDNLDDPIRFNRSDIASFSPLGGSTPGSLYFTDSLHHLSVVRLLGTTGRVRTLTYHSEVEQWR